MSAFLSFHLVFLMIFDQCKIIYEQVFKYLFEIIFAQMNFFDDKKVTISQVEDRNIDENLYLKKPK